MSVAMSALLELTVLTRPAGVMSKVISLDSNGKLHSDGSACWLSTGTAQRQRIADAGELATLIGTLPANKALALGRLKPRLPDSAQVVTKRALGATPGAIARTAEHLEYVQGAPAFALIDIDPKGMPPDMLARIKAAGGYAKALASVLPDLATCATVQRASTSAGISRTDINPPQAMPASNGAHLYVAVADGADIPRFLKDFAARCWLAGFGWMTIGASGQLLSRSLVDACVGSPEHLVFEGRPHVVAPLVQSAEVRKPRVVAGGFLDTIQACPPLGIAEKARLKELQAAESQRLKGEAAQVRAAYVARRAGEIAQHHGRAEATPADQRAAERACDGKLLSTFVLPFDDPALAGCTVGDVLADRDRFDGETMADPNEGIEYGACKAMVMRRADGAPWIHSFAHGRTVYELYHDADAMRAALKKIQRDQIMVDFGPLCVAADLTSGEYAEIRKQAAELSGAGVRELDRAKREAQAAHDAARKQEEKDRRDAGRQDPRLRIPAPLPDAPWLPEMKALNDVLGACTAPEPPMRDLAGYVTQVRLRPVSGMHALTAESVNEGDTKETRLPPPEQPLLSRLDEAEIGELIERHIDYCAADGERSMHLALPFVRHYLCRHDGALPAVSAVATLPMVLPDGTILSGRGLDRKCGVVFRVPVELDALLPTKSDCTPSAVGEAMKFLMDEWLCDVATNNAGKCVLVAMALTIIERLLLPERPAFFITAGQRACGKTTATNMIATAVLGCRASAAAWSPSDEERRKSLLAYLGEGVPLIAWDNIPRGAMISCPSIEKALTAGTYSDRVLGVSETRTVPATAIMLFTGNNIGPRGDLASRSLTVRLESDRPDPEHRDFLHGKPVEWTEANRGRILRSLYTLLVGNPRAHAVVPADTRFKAWWRLVGSAVEFAVLQSTGEYVSFLDAFAAQEENDEDVASLGDALTALHAFWPPDAPDEKNRTFTAGDLANKLSAGALVEMEGKVDVEATVLVEKQLAVVAQFLFAEMSNPVITKYSVTQRLKVHVGAAVFAGGGTLSLRSEKDQRGKAACYFIRKS